MVSRESDRDSKVPIENRDFGEEEHAGRNSGNAGNPWTENLFMEEFEKRKRQVGISKKELRPTSGLVTLQRS